MTTPQIPDHLDALRVRLATSADIASILQAEDGVFDGPADPDLTRRFLEDPRHELAIATSNDRVVGMASGVHYLHPDKPLELWINEVGVAPGWRRRGLARQLIAVLLERGRELGCASAWVLTDQQNGPARELYRRAGGVETDGVVMVEWEIEGLGGDS